MKNYEKRLLNSLIDKYERSSLYYQNNKRTQNIQVDINKKLFPEYFNERTLDYVDINTAFKILEEKEWILIIWRDNIKDHIISKVRLNINKLTPVYRFLKRTPKSKTEANFLKQLRKLKRQTKELKTTTSFLNYLEDRVVEGKSVKAYIDIKNLAEFNDLILGLSKVESNTQDCYIREFSIRVYGDSKRFEKFLSKILKIIGTFNSDWTDIDSNLILEEFHIFRNPNYVFLKGDVWFEIGNDAFDISGLKQGIAISGEDIKNLEFLDGSSAKEVITIENFTTFARWEKPNALIIYLGGYHNRERRELLNKVFNAFPKAHYYHFGDIDIGGFEIYLDLISKTGIPFKPYLMSEKELIKYKSQAKLLTKNDISRLTKLTEKVQHLDSETGRNISRTLTYMQDAGIKLEQEAILLEEN